MPDEPALPPDMVQRVAAQLLQRPLAEADARLVCELLDSLGRDLSAMRGMDVTGSEPAAIYLPAEGER